MSKKRLFINLFSNIISFVVSLAISFLITPIIVSKIGDAAYGFVGLANNFVSYANIFTVIINSMASRFVSYELNNNNNEEANKYYSSVFYMNLLLSVIILIFSIILIINLTNFINVPSNLIADVKITFVLAFINLILSLFISLYNISAFTKNRLDLTAIRNIIGNIIKVILLFILFSFFEAKIYFIIFSTILMSCYILFSNYKLSKKLSPELKISKSNFCKKNVLTLTKAGIWNSINSLSKTLLTGIDLLIANIFIGAGPMGILSIAKTVPTAIESLLVVFANTFNPEFVILYSKNKIEELKKHVIFSIKIVSFFMIVPLAGYIVFGAEFFSLWLPGKSANNIMQIQILSILSIAPFLVSSCNYTLFVIDSVTNQLKRPVIATLVMSIFSTITTLVLLKNTDLGIYAIAGTSSIFWIIKVVTFNNINAAINLKLKWYTFFGCFFKNILNFIIVLISFIFLKQYVVIDSLLDLFLAASIFGIIGYALMFILSFNTKEKKNIINKVYKKIRKRYVCSILLFIFIFFMSSYIYIYNYQIKFNNTNEEKIIHISIDDSIEIFDDLTKNQNNYKTIFDNSLLYKLKQLNKNYDAKFTLYCFGEINNKNLKNMTGKYIKEFEENSYWLKFGYHALSPTIDSITYKEYDQMMSNLTKIVGKTSITNTLRLEKFLGKESFINSVNEYSKFTKIKTLLGADTLFRTDYWLNNKENIKLFKDEKIVSNNINIYNTDLRLEKVYNIKRYINKLANDNNLIVFTHEWALDDNMEKLEFICEYAKDNNYKFMLDLE